MPLPAQRHAQLDYEAATCRVGYFWEAYSLNRAFFAFVLDAGLYSVFQAVLLTNAPPVYRFTPFFGLAAWLVRPAVLSKGSSHVKG